MRNIKSFYRSPLFHVRLFFFAVFLTGCGGHHESKTQAQASDVVVGVAVGGPTPFISFVPLSGRKLRYVKTYRYLIQAKATAVSQPVDISYSAAALIRKGHYIDGAATATLPVFGLYAEHLNHVSLALTYADGSQQDLKVDIPTPQYIDPSHIYDRPTILKKRVAGGSRDLNYFYMKSAAGPIVADSDGAIRWVAPVVINGYSSIFDADNFLVGGQTSRTLTRIELDGAVSAVALLSSTATNFHHNISPGAAGMLGEIDAVIGGVPVVETIAVEFDASGTIGKEWDFADIVARYMRAHGDDPGPFVRPGTDWFHMNAAIYDRRDNSIIASSRENFVIKVDYATGDIKWILGDPTKYWHTFPSLRAKALALEAGGLYPIGQHGLSITAAGELMLFNNGAQSFNQPAGAPAGESRLYSAVSSYVIDTTKMTAREAWNFDYNKSIFSDICSSASETRAGSILVNYSTANGRTRSRLVGLDAARGVLFDIEYASNSCDTSWNAEPVAFDGMNIR